MRVLICGSRGWSDSRPIRALVDSLPDGTTVVHGAAPGADSLAGEAVRLRRVASGGDIKEERHPADWARHGRAAGPIRNREMLNSGIDQVYAFRLPGESPGTDHMVRIAREAGIPVTVLGPKAEMGNEKPRRSLRL